MPTWTPIAKPTGTPYSNVNPQGREEYDQSDIVYDSSSVFYDGVNPTAYTSVAKPTSSTWSLIQKPTN